MRHYFSLWMAGCVFAAFVLAKMAVLGGDFTHRAAANVDVVAAAAAGTDGPAEDFPLRLTGLVGGEVQDMLREPELVRADGPVVVWQYRNESCVLDVFFKVNGGRDASRADVVHHEVRARRVDGLDSAVQEECLVDLIMDRGQVKLADARDMMR